MWAFWMGAQFLSQVLSLILNFHSVAQAGWELIVFHVRLKLSLPVSVSLVLGGWDSKPRPPCRAKGGGES